MNTAFLTGYKNAADGDLLPQVQRQIGGNLDSGQTLAAVALHDKLRSVWRKWAQPKQPAQNYGALPKAQELAGAAQRRSILAQSPPRISEPAGMMPAR